MFTEIHLSNFLDRLFEHHPPCAEYFLMRTETHYTRRAAVMEAKTATRGLITKERRHETVERLTMMLSRLHSTINSQHSTIFAITRLRDAGVQRATRPSPDEWPFRLLVQG